MFRKKTIDSVLAVAQGVVADLEDLTAQHIEAATDTRNDISDLEEKLAVQDAEAKRAHTLATKWAELV